MRNRIIVLIMIIIMGYAVESSYIQQLVEKEASKTFSQAKRIDVQIIQEPFDSKKISQEDIAIESLDIRPGITVLNLKAIINGQEKRVRYLTKVRVFEEVPVLTESVARWQEFSVGNIEKIVVDVSDLLGSGKTWVKNPEDAKGYRFLRTVRKGSILLSDVLEKTPDIKKNDVLSLQVKEGGIELTCDVIALEEGFVGDTIEVMHETYKRKLKAVVKDGGVIELKG